MSGKKPLLIYDGDCNFCRRWIARWRLFTGDRVDYAPFQEVGLQFPEIPAEKFRASVQLVEPDGQISEGAKAVFRTLTYTQNKGWLYWMYDRMPLFRPVTEWFYALVAKNRPVFSFLTRLLWGDTVLPQTYSFTSWLFLRLLGGVYLIAFLSLAVQITGLVGENGILPAGVFLDLVSQRMGIQGMLMLPSVFWFNTGDFFLQLSAWAGVVLGAVLAIGIAQGPVLFLLWFLYLSFFSIGGEFLSFQWDILLLETGFLAIFLSSLDSWTRSGFLKIARPFEPSGVVLWLYRWLLFRLMFFSGFVKLASGDPAWGNLTALSYHYETQPLPTVLGWFAYQLPMGVHKFSALAMFATELVIPFFVFAPRRLRISAALLMISLQTLIFLTGNYCFFNILAIMLCLLLIDDQAWPWRWKKKSDQATIPAPALIWPKAITVSLASFILIVSTIQFTSLFRLDIRWPRPMVMLYNLSDSFHIVNSYGLFAIMTTQRPEIIVEGSRDGQTWQAYEFKYKPGDLKRMPAFVQPHQPRLDWQMWFAALSPYSRNPWFKNFCIRLIQGSPEVLRLLKTNPFPDRPPRFIRASLYDYRFTNLDTLKSEGAWWKRSYEGPYSPALSLD